MLKTMEETPVNNPLKDAETRALIDQILDENKGIAGATMVVLNNLQEAIGFISPEMQVYVAEQMGEPISRIHGVVSFY